MSNQDNVIHARTKTASGVGWSLSKDRSRLQLDVVHAWLATSYWSPDVSRGVMERAFANSIAVGAYDPRDAQIGVARVVSDQATFAWLCDVFVAEGWRGRGVARGMVRELLADDRLQTLRRWCLATRDAHEVYRPLGFSPVDAGRWMEHRPDPAAWKSDAR